MLRTLRLVKTYLELCDQYISDAANHSDEVEYIPVVPEIVLKVNKLKFMQNYQVM